MLDIVVEGRMELDVVNNTKTVFEGDEAEVVCSVSDTFPAPDLSWSTPDNIPDILYTYPTYIVTSMAGLVSVQQRAFYKTKSGETLVNISCMARQGNITRRSMSKTIKVLKKEKMEKIVGEEQTIGKLTLMSGILFSSVLFLVILILLILHVRKRSGKKNCSNIDLVDHVKTCDEEDRVKYEKIDTTYLDLFSNGLPQKDVMSSSSFSTITSCDSNEEPDLLESKYVDPKQEEEVIAKEECSKSRDYLETHFDLA